MVSHMAQAPMMRATVQQLAIPAVNLPQPGAHGHHRAPVLSPKGEHPQTFTLDGTAVASGGVPATPGRTAPGTANLSYPSGAPHLQPAREDGQPTTLVQQASASAPPGPAQHPPPGRSGSGPLLAGGPGAYPSTPSRCRSAQPPPAQERLPSPETSRVAARCAGLERGASPDPQAVSASTSSLRRGANTHSAALLAPAAVAIAASTPVLRGRPGATLGPASSTATSNGCDAKSAAARSASPGLGIVSKSSLLAGSSLGHLISRVTTSVQEREQEIRRQQTEKRELEDLLTRSKEELQQLVSVVSQLHELQQSANEVLPDMLNLGPERPRLRAKPPFFWQPSQEYAEEFEVSGECGEVVTKTKDFEDQGWVIPVGGSWRLARGGLYRWTVRVERKCPSRPQLQLGIHGINHSQPWRLVTTSRCSWSRDDEPWQDRPGGDRLIDEGDYVHIEVDLRGVTAKCGLMALGINDEPMEQFFDDIPLGTHYPLIPVVSMGGDQSRVRLCPNY